MATYTVQVRRDGLSWNVHVPSLGVIGQVPHFWEVEGTARSLIADLLRAPSDSFDIRFVPAALAEAI